MIIKEKKIQELLFVAINASLKAGDEILKVYDSEFAVNHKDDNSPITKADENAHHVISELLKETDLPVLSEEGKDIDYSSRKDWDFFWMVDPLDGTKEFVKRNGEFTVNIALIHEQRSILGVIYVPVTKILYFGAEGVGSYKLEIRDMLSDNIQGIITQSVKLPIENPDKKFTVVASRSHLSEETEMFIDGLKTQKKSIEFLSSGSSLKFCLVAEGKADIYPRFTPTMEWDTAAGQSICQNAGKAVLDYKSNKPLLYNKKNLQNNWFIVS